MASVSASARLSVDLYVDLYVVYCMFVQLQGNMVIQYLMYFRYSVEFEEPDPKDTSYRPTVEDMMSYYEDYLLDMSLRYVIYNIDAYWSCTNPV
jgi:hypothetical protein